jgi:hypothetical protein
MFVTTATYYTLTRLHSLQTLHSNLCCTIAHKVSCLTQYVFITYIHTSNKHSVHTLHNCFLPRTYCLALTLKTDCLDISVLLINPQSYEQRELCCVTMFTAALPRKQACCRVTSSRLLTGDVFQCCCVMSSRLRGEDPASLHRRAACVWSRVV